MELLAAKGHPTAIAALQGPDMPDALAYLWEWWQELNSARGSNGMGGPAAITYRDIQAWAALTDRRPLPYEVAGILRLDAAVRDQSRDDG